MINCTLNNYREWIGAYMDGSLSPGDMRSAEAFLEQHPDLLDEYLQELEEFSVAPGTEKFTGKDSLSILVRPTPSIHAQNFQEVFVSFYEKELTPAQVSELNTFLSFNPSLEKEFKVLGAAYLQPDLTIRYPDKKQLTRKTGTIVPLFWRMSAAASVIAIIGTGLLVFRSNGTTSHNGIALYQPGNFIAPAVEEKNNPGNLAFEKDNVVNKINDDQLAVNHSSITTTTQNTRESSEAIHTGRMQTILVQQTSGEIAIKQVPEVDHYAVNSESPVTEEKPAKKGILNKIVSGEKIYIEDYVNATFSVFKDNDKEDSKWVLKVDRDKNGKSRKVKFSSPLFSIKTND